MLAWRLLWRNWRSSELRILSAALLLAVAVVTAITVFAARMDASLLRQSNSYLAADRIIEGRFPIPASWQSEAAIYELQQALTAEFSSMVFAGDEMALASVKAVAANYPLRGELEIADEPFAAADKVRVSASGPPAGELWVDGRLLSLLQLRLGEQLQVGERELRISALLVREPDAGNNLFVLGPRVLMNIDDLPSTEVVQPGSRVTYKLLLAGDEPNLNRFVDAMRPQLGAHHRLEGLAESQQSLAAALKRGSNFLLLAGMVGVMLAGVAIAIAAQQFAARHQDQVALMKSLGVSAARVRGLYLLQMLWLAVLATALGLLLGELCQRLIATTISALVQVELLSAPLAAYGVGLVTGVLCLLCFVLPPLWHLPAVSPLKILRRELTSPPLHRLGRALCGVAAVVLLLVLYGSDWPLTLAMVAGLVLLLALGALLCAALLLALRQLVLRQGSLWRLALASLERHRQQTLVQTLVFAAALMLLMVLFMVRSSLIEEWRLQLPTDAANHFLVNIASHEIEPLQQLLATEQVADHGFFPMIMGRLMTLNGEALTSEQRQSSGPLRRELNLSWSEQLAADNRIEAGQWWPNWQPQHEGMAGVSVEQGLASELELKLGDRLGFSIGGLELEAEVASIRSLDWNSMRPNFFFLFSPAALNQFSPSYMTSIYLPQEQKLLLNKLLQALPTVVVIEVDRLLERIRVMVSQVARSIELVLWLVLVGGLLVLVAAVNASMSSRMQDAGLLRALGSSRRTILGSIAAEFSLLGGSAGLIAALGAETLLALLQWLVFKQTVHFHPELWLAGPLAGALLVAAIGLFCCRRVVLVSPWRVLREL